MIKESPDDLAAYVTEANALFAQAQWEAARQIFEKICLSFPTHNIEGWVGLAKVAFRQRQWQQALNYCEQALNQDNNHFQAHIVQGNTLYKLCRFRQAASAFERVIEISPNRLIGYRRLAELAMRLQQWPLAAQRFQTVAQKFPTELVGFVGEVNALIRQEDFLTAKARLQAMNAEQLCQPPVLRALIAVGFYTQDWRIAIAQTKSFIDQNQTQLTAFDSDNAAFKLLNYLFNRLLDSGEFGAVDKLLNKLEAQSVSAVAIALWHSKTAHCQGLHQEAQQYCTEAIQKYPEQVSFFHLQLAQNAKRELCYDQVLFWARQVIPSHVEPYKEATILIAQTLIRLEQFDRAKKATRRLIRHSPSSPAGYRMLVEILYYQDHDYEQVLRVCAQAIKRGAISTQIYVCKSLALLALREWKKAQRTSAQCLRQDPENRLLLMVRAEVLHQAGEPNQAISTINQWLQAGNFSPIASKTNKLNVQYLECDPGYTVNEKEKASVVMTTYGADDMLPIAIASILNQTYQNLELIIVDDSSPDNTFTCLQAIAAKDNRIRLIQQKKNGGTYVAKNCGMQIASGQYITFMDSDDWLHPQALEQQIETLRSTGAKGVLCGYFRVDQSGSIEFKPEGPTQVAPITLCFEREPVLETIGYFDSIRFAADAEYVNRFKAVYGANNIKRIEFPLLASKRHEHSLTGSGPLKLKWHGPDLVCDCYRANFRLWHSQVRRCNHTAYISHPLDYRRFAVPEIMT